MPTTKSLAGVRLQSRRMRGGDRQRNTGKHQRQHTALVRQPRSEEIHGRRADESGYEQVGRPAVELHGVGDLLDDALLHDGDAVAQRQGFILVVGDVDHRRRQPAMQPGNLGAHLQAQGGIQVRERLVEQEHARLAHHGAPQGDSLALAAGQVSGFAFQQAVRRAARLPLSPA